jgi:glycine cleavage system aminomethyltransferase T
VQRGIVFGPPILNVKTDRDGGTGIYEVALERLISRKAEFKSQRRLHRPNKHHKELRQAVGFVKEYPDANAIAVSSMQQLIFSALSEDMP